MNAASSKKVIVVDDDPDIVELLVVVLNLNGYEALGITNPATVLQLVEDVEPSAIILDIGLGAYNGLQICKEIKLRHENLPVIIISAYEDVERGLHIAGADAFIAKPFEISYVEKVVSSLA